jgi:hypothetical protein
MTGKDPNDASYYRNSSLNYPSTGEAANQSQKPIHTASPQSLFPHLPKLTSPKVVDEKTYTTAEGFERKESIIIHPPTLADPRNSGYSGPVRTMHFYDGVQGEDEEEVRRKLDKGLDNVPEVLPYTLKELTDALPEVEQSEQNQNGNAEPSVRRKPAPVRF